MQYATTLLLALLAPLALAIPQPQGGPVSLISLVSSYEPHRTSEPHPSFSLHHESSIREPHPSHSFSFSLHHDSSIASFPFPTGIFPREHHHHPSGSGTGFIGTGTGFPTATGGYHHRPTGIPTGTRGFETRTKKERETLTATTY